MLRFLHLPAFAAMSLVLALAGPACGQGPEYVLHIIAPLGGGTLGEAYAEDINNLNHVVGFTTGSQNGFLWTPSAGATPMFAATAIADDDTIVRNGALYDLSGALLQSIPPAGTFSTMLPSNVVLVQGMHVVVGRAVIPGQGTNGCSSSNFGCINHAAHVAFIWDPVAGTRNLDTLGVPNSFEAHDVNAAGLVVGDTNSTNQKTSTFAFVFDLGTGQYVDLGTLRPDNLGVSSALAVNYAGHVVGFATAPGSSADSHAFIWHATSGMQDLGTLGGTSLIDDSYASDINQAGVVVGRSYTTQHTHALASRHAIVWDAAQGMRDLNHLVALPANYELVDAVAINDAGWICGVGVGSAGNGFYSAFVLEPIGAPPAPSFVRGDCNVDGSINLADPVVLLGHLFGGATIACMDACDATDDGTLNIADPVRMLAVLFQGALPLPAPGPACGPDTTPSTLDCAGATGCP